MSILMPIPMTLLAGFLDAGKTTRIESLFYPPTLTKDIVEIASVLFCALDAGEASE